MALEPPHSALSIRAVGVLAATCAGMAATTLARTRAPIPTRITDTDGNGRLGNRIDLPGEQNPQPSPHDDADRHPDDDPDHGVDRGLPRHGCTELPLGETERLQQSQIASPSAHRRHQCQGERRHGAQREARDEQGGRGPDGAVVHNFGGALRPRPRRWCHRCHRRRGLGQMPCWRHRLSVAGWPVRLPPRPRGAAAPGPGSAR